MLAVLSTYFEYHERHLPRLSCNFEFRERSEDAVESHQVQGQALLRLQMNGKMGQVMH